MPSLSRCCATATSLLLPLFLTLVFGIQGATLREHRLSGTEPASFGPGSQLRPPPSAEMLRALQYIQSLSQRTAPEPVSDDLQPAAMDGERDDMENVRSMLQLVAPGRSTAGVGRGMDEREEDKDQDHTQQWLQAVLTTLQKTEEQMTPPKTPQKSPQNSSPSHPHYSIQPLPRPKQQVGTSAENYLANRRPHRQYPLLFEDEEGQEQPLKRTNENAEEQYTPQKLATLQSVFEELSRISASKTNSKRDSTAATTAENDDDEDNDEDDDDLYRQRKMALEDIMGTDEWEPLEEQIETEEEERERHEYNRNLEDDEQEEEDEKEEEDDDVKRSSQSDLFQTEKGADPEDIAKLVDYYLLKVLEKKEQEEQKREDTRQREEEEGDEDSDREEEKTDVDEEEEEGEEERDEVQRDIKPFQGPFPKSLSQLIKISQTLQIPPEEVLDLLQNERQKNFFGIPPRSQAQSRKPPRTYTITRGAQSAFAAAPHRRPLEAPETNSVVRDILSILELASTAKQNDKFRQQPMRLKTSRYYERPRDLPDYVFPKSSRDDYDDTVDEEDELANYLASEMLAQGQRRARLTPPRDDERSAYGKLERAVQDYFDKTTSENRPSEQEGTTIDDDTMLKILRYLDPDTDNTAETDSEGKTVPEM